MAETTLISWADKTWSPWTGCAKVSLACSGCYAAFLMDTRHHRAEWGGPGEGVGTRSRMSADYWRKPLAWDRDAAKTGAPCLVFPSLCDPFDNHPDVTPWRAEWADLIRRTPNLTWLLLTKRIGNAEKMLRIMFPEGVPSNVWLGVTVVTQDEADRDLPKAAAVKSNLGIEKLFVSIEPMIEAIDLNHLLYHPCPKSADMMQDPSTGVYECCSACDYTGIGDELAVDWVITGGETDQGTWRARPWNPQWARDIRDACAEAGVAYHHKQNGEWITVRPEYPGISIDKGLVIMTDGQSYRDSSLHVWPDGSIAVKVGKAKSDRFLDGVVHDARPS